MNDTEELSLQPTGKTYFFIAALLAGTIALAPFALDTYLPAFPEMAQALNTSVHDISLTIGVYVFFLALGQLVGGPLADQFGRSRIMIGGVAVFAIASMVMSYVTTFSDLMIARVFQALGGGLATVCVSAIVRDRFSGKEAARFFSTIGLIMILAPAVAPTLGSILLEMFGWRSIFIFLTVYALVLIPLISLGLFGNAPKFVPQPSTGSLLQKYKAVLQTTSAMPYLFIQTMSFAVMLSFLGHASFIYQEHFGASTTLFPILLGCNVALMIIMNLCNRVALNKHDPDTIMRWALIAQCLGVTALLAVVLFSPSLTLFLPAMVITIGTMGASTPNCQACFMEYFDTLSGTAAAVLGASQFALAALITSVATILLPESLFYIVAVQAICAYVSLILALRFAKMPSPATSANH